MQLEVRREVPDDRAAIHALNAAVFPTDAEARLVDALRANGTLALSLVAVVEGAIVGHIAFSPVVIESEERVVHAIGLAPMGVAVSHQRTGIGARLIADGLQELRGEGHRVCVVLGHPAYYPRYGFVRAATHGIRWEHGHDAAFFVQALVPDGLAGVRGVVRYRPELDAV